MSEPVWVDKTDCLSAHDKLLRHFGGASGIRDEGLLSSALARPEQLFHYEKASTFELAACYAHGIVKNHPFVDGNKRTGFVAAALFLEANGFSLRAPEEEAVVQTLGLASGAIGEADYAAWLKGGSEPRDQ
jgi:death-on-curing protein